MGNKERGLVEAGPEDSLCLGLGWVLGEDQRVYLHKEVWSLKRDGASGKLQG